MSKKGWHLLLVSRMITIADKEGWRQKNVQKKKIMGTENVDKEPLFLGDIICEQPLTHL